MTAAKQAVLDPGMTHVMAPDERRRRLASGAQQLFNLSNV